MLLGWHQPTRDYAARRTAQDKTRTEILCCLSATSPARSSQCSATLATNT
jgi:hypothetical protein